MIADVCTADFELVELIDRLDFVDLQTLAREFDVLGAVQRHRIRGWAEWWRWRVYRALGADEIQPPCLPMDYMATDERQAAMEDWIAFAERHRNDEELLAFATGVAARLHFSLARDEVERQDLRDTIARSRERINRERAEGKRRVCYVGDGVR